jgi:hypothetical protein
MRAPSTLVTLVLAGSVFVGLLTLSACSGEPGAPREPGDQAESTATSAQALQEIPIIQTRAQAIAVMDEVDGDMTQTAGLAAQMNGNFVTLSTAYGQLSAASAAVNSAASAVTAGTGTVDQLLAATSQMQETQMSFNLQYLQLQSQMQNDNRQYSAVSNIMKTKHDTVKNSISNIR